MGLGHGGAYGQPYGGEFARAATAGEKWRLKDNREAGELFTGNPCGLSQSTVWTGEKKNMP